MGMGKKRFRGEYFTETDNMTVMDAAVDVAEDITKTETAPAPNGPAKGLINSIYNYMHLDEYSLIFEFDQYGQGRLVGVSTKHGVFTCKPKKPENDNEPTL